MSIPPEARRKASAIVSIFETGKPLGDPSTVAVLKDDAGISYGTHQATHKSGSLAAVVERFIQLADLSADDDDHSRAAALNAYLPVLKDPAKRHTASRNAQLKKLLREAGRLETMQRAQAEVFEELYMAPALKAFERSHFQTPLALGVIFDSHIQGSWALIRDRVRLSPHPDDDPAEFEKAWITRYVTARDRWLEGHSKKVLRNTDYRTDFWLEQIRRGNWELDAPMTLRYNNGGTFIIRASMLGSASPDAEVEDAAANPLQPAPPVPASPAAPEPGDASLSPAIAVPQAVVEHAEAVTIEPNADPVPGGAVDDPPVQASQGGTKSLWATISGVSLATVSGAIGFLKDNASLVTVCVIVGALLLLALIFRQLIMDYLRMKLFADPKQINVK